MDPVTMSLILGGTGLVKGMTVDKWKEDRDRWLASQTQRYSPWTGLRAGEIKEADPFGNTMQGAFSGMAQGQKMQEADAGQKLMEAQTKYYNGLNGGGIGMEGGEEEAPASGFNWQPWSNYRKQRG